MYDSGGASLTASGCESEVRVVENVTEMKQPQIGGGLGFGLRPGLGPIVPNVRSNSFNRGIGVKSP